VIVGFMRLLGHSVDKHMKSSLRKVRMGGHCSQKRNRSAVLRDIALKSLKFLLNVFLYF